MRTQGGDGHPQASDRPGAVLAPRLCRNTLVWGFGPPDPEDVRLLEHLPCQVGPRKLRQALLANPRKL